MWWTGGRFPACAEAKSHCGAHRDAQDAENEVDGQVRNRCQRAQSDVCDDHRSSLQAQRYADECTHQLQRRVQERPLGDKNLPGVCVQRARYDRDDNQRGAVDKRNGDRLHQKNNDDGDQEIPDADFVENKADKGTYEAAKDRKEKAKEVGEMRGLLGVQLGCQILLVGAREVN